MNSLARRKDKLEDVELVHVLLLGEDPLAKPEMEDHFRHNSLKLQERTIALINVADPKFRPDLIKEAKGRYLLR